MTDLLKGYWDAPFPKDATIMDVAMTQLSVKEATGNNDGVPAKRYMRGDKLPWCAGFILACAHKARGKMAIARSVKEYYKLRNVGAFEKEMKARGWWRARGPIAGDIVFFRSRGMSDKGRGRHVGLVEYVDTDGFIHTVEGNVSHRVKKLKHHTSEHRITGYATVPAALPGGFRW